MINIYEPNIDDYNCEAINAIHSGWISNHGKYVKLATEKLKKIFNIPYVILMNNGTSATHCLFLSLQYKYPNIELIYVPENCYVAAWNAALMVYPLSKINLVAMNINTWNMDLENNIESFKKDSAILIVHNLGNIINVNKYKEKRPDLIFVEDNCEGLFGKYDEIYSGMSNSTLCSSCSFYGNKIITTGEGGAFFTHDYEIFKYINSVYSQGMSAQKYIHEYHAYNYRMTNVQAAFLYSQLNDYENIINNKYRIFKNYEKLLDQFILKKKIKLFREEENTKYAPWIFGFRILNNKYSIKETFDFFIGENIDTRPFFYPINAHAHLLEFENLSHESYLLNKEILMIPSSPMITLEEQEKVVNTIEKFIKYQNIVKIDQENVHLLGEFIKNPLSKYFRYFEKRDENVIQNHYLTILYLDNDQKPIGYGHIDKKGDISSMGLLNNENIYELGICLLEGSKGQGIGKLIMKYLLENTKEIDEIHLLVDKDNEIAFNMYKKFKFSIMIEKENFYLMNRIRSRLLS